jgi:glutamate dehydrogenase/leucine dehydrogenase
MFLLLEKYKNKTPEIIFEWNDAQTDAQGWVVINSLRGGAAGGGTRMRKGLTKEEVISLAKVMEVKFSVSGPAIGGAKSGINFDPQDPRKKEVLERWYQAIFPILKNYYGTGGDLNIDELKDVIPITESLGLWHPQEGIVNGHLHSQDGDAIKILGQLRYGCSKIIEDSNYKQDGPKKYAVADLITGFGVAQSVVHFFDIYFKEDLKGKRVIIQGWGNVAAAAASFLAKNGALVVGIIDRNGGLINEKGYDLTEIKYLFDTKNGNSLAAPNLIPFEEINEKIWKLKADIFIPGAASKIVSSAQIKTLISNGLKLVSCGANVPFTDDEVFFGPTAKWADEIISIVPDFIANCGMARVFAYLMQPDSELTDESIFQDVSNTIRNAILKVYQVHESPTSFTYKALELSLTKLNS